MTKNATITTPQATSTGVWPTAKVRPATPLEGSISLAKMLRERLLTVNTGHPWDKQPIRDCVALCEHILGELNLVDERAKNGPQIEDQPRVNYDPATDQAVPVEPAPQPITESLMRAAQVGWVVKVRQGLTGTVTELDFDGFVGCFNVGGAPFAVFYKFKDCGVHRTDSQPWDLVSLAPPEVPANV